MTTRPQPTLNAGQERRTVALDAMQVRGTGSTPPVITGRAVLYGVWSEDLGGFRERIMPGAATKTLTEADVRALFNHDPNFVIGRTKAGTLTLAEDREGVSIRATPPDASWASDLMASMRRGDIDQMSFAFTAIRDVWRKPKRAGDLWERDVSEIRMHDVSVVTQPAYLTTSAQVRSRRRTGSAADLRLRVDVERASA